MKSPATLFHPYRGILLICGVLVSLVSLVPIHAADDVSVSGNLFVSGVADVYGNTLNLGSWIDDSTKLGVSITYAEFGPAISRRSIFSLNASRPTMNWWWQKQATTSGGAPIPQMILGSNNVLTLFDQTSPNPNGAIVLDPLVRSTFATPVTFNGSDNQMPNQTPNNPANVLTVGLADARYLVTNSGNKLTIGAGATATGDQSIALGYQANASGVSSTVLGDNSAATVGIRLLWVQMPRQVALLPLLWAMVRFPAAITQRPSA